MIKQVSFLPMLVKAVHKQGNVMIFALFCKVCEHFKRHDHHCEHQTSSERKVSSSAVADLAWLLEVSHDATWLYCCPERLANIVRATNIIGHNTEQKKTSDERNEGSFSAV